MRMKLDFKLRIIEKDHQKRKKFQNLKNSKRKNQIFSNL